MKSLKPLFVAAFFLAGAQTIGDVNAKGSKPPVSDINVSGASSGPNSATVASSTTTHKPEDYYVPLDNYLKRKGSPLSGKDAWEVGRQYNVDPDVLIAITGSETNFCTHKQRGSEFNCGSVGSYDSTNTTMAATSYRHGFEQIAQTLNGPLLRNAVRVSELSRKRNKDPQRHIYASSEFNWDNNTTRYLQEIKGQNQEDFFVRLDRNP